MDGRPGDRAEDSTTFARVAVWCGTGAALLGVLGLVGWGLGWPLLTSVRSTYRPIAPSAACALVVLGLVQLAFVCGRLTHLTRAGAVAMSGFLALYGLLEVVGTVAGADLNREGVLTSYLARVWTRSFTPMSPAAGALMGLIGAALLALLMRPEQGQTRATWLGGLAGALAAAAGAGATTFVLGYINGAPDPAVLRVEIRVWRTSDALHVSVWNSGPPIAMGFEVTKEAKTGLDLVHTVVEDQYGGVFRIGPDRGGTTAEIVLDEARLCSEG